VVDRDIAAVGTAAAGVVVAVAGTAVGAVAEAAAVQDPAIAVVFAVEWMGYNKKKGEKCSNSWRCGRRPHVTQEEKRGGQEKIRVSKTKGARALRIIR